MIAQMKTPSIMEECVKLNVKIIVCMKWCPETLLLHFAKVPQKPNANEYQ